MLLLSVNTFIRITGTPKHIHTNHMQRDTPPPHHPDKHIQHPPHGHTHAPQHLNIKALNSNRTQKVLKNESMDRSKCSTRHLLDVYFQTSMRISHSATMEFAFPVVHCTRKRGVIQTASVVHAFVYTFVYSLECMLSVLPAVPSPSRLPCSRARCLPPLGNTVQGYHQFVRFTPSLPWWRGSPEHSALLRSTSSTHPLADP